MAQVFYWGIEHLKSLLQEMHTDAFLLVCDGSFDFLPFKQMIEDFDIKHLVFNDFSSNPLHEDARKGLKILKEQGIKTIVAVGGGSSLDVAKCIKLDAKDGEIKIVAIPTTAGTGSESTRHIVVYENGNKQSLGDESVLPDYVIFEPEVLKTLPLYQKKATLFDALCQCIESYWSINANETSRPLSLKGMKLIKDNMDSYILENDETVYKSIMEAANLSGQAINITQTTAAHAMSYKITSLYRFPHGHAVAVCLPHVWRKMLEHKELDKTFNKIAEALGFTNPKDAILWFEIKMREYGLDYPSSNRYEEDIALLTDSVNPIRLKNNPVQFSREELEDLYRGIIKNES